jgi:hypothetical protein
MPHKHRYDSREAEEPPNHKQALRKQFMDPIQQHLPREMLKDTLELLDTGMGVPGVQPGLGWRD